MVAFKINGLYIHLVIIIFFVILVCFLVSTVHLFVSLTSVGHFLMVDLSTHCALPCIDRASSGQMAETTVTTFLLHKHSDLCSQLYLNLSLTFSL